MGLIIGNINAVGRRRRGESNPELFTIANAASDPAGNEADDTTGFVSVGLDGSNIFASQGTVKSDGSYAIEANANPTPTSICRFSFDFTQLSLTELEEYTLILKCRHVGTGGNWKIGTSNSSNGLVGGDSDTIFTESLTFAEFSYDFIFSATGIKYLLGREQNTPNDGGIYIDNISLKKKVG